MLLRKMVEIAIKRNTRRKYGRHDEVKRKSGYMYGGMTKSKKK